MRIRPVSRLAAARIGRGRLIAAALAAIVTSTALGALPADAAPRHVSLSVQVLRTGASTSPDVTVVGRVSRAGLPVPGVRVALQVRTTGTSTWRTVKLTRSDGQGTVRLSRAALKRGKQFRLLRVEQAVRSVSRAVSVPVSTFLTVSASSNPTPTAGDEVLLRGTTNPGLVGARVHLQLLVDQEWRSVSSSVVAGDATYAVRAIATLGGDRQYRALVKAAPGRPETVSPTRELTVYAWYRLARATALPVADAAPLAAGREAVGGQPYIDGLGRTLLQGERAASAFDLHNRCLAFRTTYGPTSDSGAGFYGVFRARADDDTLLDVQLDRGSVQQARVDVTGASRLTLISAAAADTGDAAWGDPEVLCAGL